MSSMTNPPTSLIDLKCRADVAALSAPGIIALLPQVQNWQYEQAPRPHIARQFDFKNYFETLAFINAIAYVIHAEDHHPELIVNYGSCIVKFDTHSVNDGAGGLSQNDFICAAKVNAIYQQSFI